MTLARTIHRRAARKRAKARPRYKGHKFLCGEWAMREGLDQLAAGAQVRIDLFNREYGVK